MASKYAVGQYLVDRLEQLGLGHLFSIAGDYTIQWVDQYVERSTIQVIEEVNELNAGFAADGYARIKGISAACFTYSAGTLSAVNAIAGAYVEMVPVVLINGAPSIKKKLTFEQTGFGYHHMIKGETDLKIYENITVAAVKIDNPDLAPMLIDYALTKCITERRPVYIELFEDIVSEVCEPPKGKLKPAKTISDAKGLSQAVQTIQEQLKKAKNPLIWIGVEVDRYGLHAKAEKLIRQLKIPYVTELLCKAILSESDTQFAGVYDGQSSSKVTHDLVAQSDFVLALGVWLTDINALGEPIDYNKTALFSHKALKFGTDFIPQVALGDFIEDLLDTGVSCQDVSTPLIPSDRGEVSYSDLNEKITYQGLYDFIQNEDYIKDHMLLGSDASLNYFGSILLKVGAPRSFINQSYYSAIGYIGAAATGMSLAKQEDQRVMVFSGDGGFQMCAQCLSTQTRFKLNPIIFIIDNGVYGVEQWLHDASVFATDKSFLKSCVLHRWKYSKLSEVFGCQGWEVNTYAELQNAMEGAMQNTNSPSIIQVIVPSKSIPNNAKWKESI